MQINNLKINGFGNLKNKEINFSENINLIYGQNESGKSTLLKFIIGMFYGSSKNKRGKEISDLERYTPWKQEEFSGKLIYKLDNKKTFEIFREFNKKNPKIFNENMEDISKEFNIDKTNGNEFFYEQTKIDEELFTSSLAILQTETKLESDKQNTLIQKITNLVNTGSDNISYKKAIDKLNKKYLAEIGTDKTTGRPLNIVENRIKEIEKQKEEIKEETEENNYIDEKIKNIEKEIEKNKNKIEIINKIKNINENKKIENEKIKLNKELLNKLNEKIKLNNETLNKLNEKITINEELLNKLNNQKNLFKLNKSNLNNKSNKLNKNDKKDSKYKNKNRIIKYVITILAVTLVNILNFMYIKNIEINILITFSILLLPVMAGIDIKAKNKQKKIIEEENKKVKEKEIQISYEKNNIEKEINLLGNERDEKIKEINLLENNINNEFNKKIENIKNNYLNYFDILEINNLINSININYELEKEQRIYNENKINLNIINNKKENILIKLNNLSKLEEELESMQEELKEINNKKQSIILVKDILEKAYEEMKNSVTPEFTKKLSENIFKISNEKYKNVKLNSNNELIVEIENGDYVPVTSLSVGTIDQLYFSLRLAALDNLTNEKMPIILDETFAYYDDFRLENIFKYINEKFKDHQIIILTCTNREQEILKKLNINYNFINI